MKKICFFSGSMSRGGGTEHMTQLVSNALSLDSEYDVFVLSKRDGGKPSFYPLSENIHYSALDNTAYRGVFSLVKNIFMLSGYIRRNKIDILVNVDVSLGIFTLPLKLLCSRLKQVFWEHFSVKYDVENKRMHLLRKLALKYGDAYITLTPQDCEDLKTSVKKHCEIQCIPNICPDSSKSVYNINSKKILSIGNFLHVKGFDMALETASQVFKRHPDWSWDFYGDGPEYDGLAEAAKRLHIENNVCFNGRAKELEAAYQNAAILVMTSRSEGFGLVLGEAQAYHLPTVAFDVPYGPRNIIDDGVNGFLIKPFDISCMADSICKLIENDDLRKSFSENADSKLNRFSCTNVINLWKKLFGGL